MSYKPDESILMAYLYGELDEKENEKLQQYFAENPGEQKKVQELAAVSNLLGRIKDKEVIAPPVFVEDRHSLIPLWRRPYVTVITSIAASLFVLILVARLLVTEVRYSAGELSISFGNHPAGPSGLSAGAVEEMIDRAVARNNAALAKDMEVRQAKLDESVRKNLDLNSKRVDRLVQNASAASTEQLRSFVAGLQDKNLRLMDDYFRLSTAEQKKYVENLLGDFSNYLQDQRAQDLTLVQTKVTNLEKNSDQFKQETEQILASIISNTATKKNSYE
jgi:hypothetical protein